VTRAAGGYRFGPGRLYNPRALRAFPIAKRRSRAAIAVFCGLLLGLALPSAAMAGYLAPESGAGSPNADNIRTLYIITAILGGLLFFFVEGVLVYSLIKFRWRRGGTPPAQIRGNTPLEIGWTLGAAGLLVVLTVVTFIFLPGIRNPKESLPGGYVAEAKKSGLKTPDGRGTTQFAAIDQKEPPGPASEHLEIDVNGQQYLWRFNYPSGDQPIFSYHDLVVPINTTVVLKIRASDVAHSWWIPKLGGKADAVPGHVNDTWFRISKEGSYWGNCAEFCGENHADMTARVIAVSPDEYKAFLAKQEADLKQSQALLALERRTRGEETPEEGSNAP
jgi:cytochrome c oxidase subunit II